MEILVKNLQQNIPIKTPQIQKIARKILNREKIKESSLSIVFVSAQKIRALNRKYHHRDYATDVLSFDFSSPGSRQVNGEVIVSTAAAVKNARIYQTSPQKETCLYIIHGILHLLGYDDHMKKDTLRMRKKEQQLLKLLRV